MWAIVAAGGDPAGDDWKYESQDGASALDKLRAFQNDSGAFRWQDVLPDDNFLSTVQAVVALELKTLPFATMDVGEAETPVPTPYIPTSGGNLWVTALALLSGGAALTGIGISLRKRS